MSNEAPWRVMRPQKRNVDVNYRHHHNIVVIQIMKIVDCRVIIINRAHHCGFNRRIIEKSSRQFLTALFVDPISSPANGQFFISTRRRRACRRLLPPPA
jgi:hypothetical protein